MNTDVATSERRSFSPDNLRYNVILHEAISDRLDRAIRLACGTEELVTEKNFELVDALVEISNVLDDDGMMELGMSEVSAAEMPTVKIGDSVQQWLDKKQIIRSAQEKGPMALFIGRAGWKNDALGAIVPAQQ
jgi:hypothetical protein